VGLIQPQLPARTGSAAGRVTVRHGSVLVPSPRAAAGARGSSGLRRGRRHPHPLPVPSRA